MKKDGFSLIEVLVATTITIVAVASLAQLFVLSTNANTSARAMSMTLLLAEAKMAQLRSLVWGFDALGAPLTDDTTDTTTVPMSATGGTGLGPSPPGALSANTPGYVDYVDGKGVSLGVSGAPPAGAVYVRRWSIEPLPTNPSDTLVLQVRVMGSGNRGLAAWTDLARRPDEARLVAVRTRKPN